MVAYPIVLLRPGLSQFVSNRMAAAYQPGALGTVKFLNLGPAAVGGGPGGGGGRGARAGRHASSYSTHEPRMHAPAGAPPLTL